jgi:hypothetical protein
MKAVLTRTAARRPTHKPPESRELLAAVAQSVAERVTLPHRDLPPEWFRFPLP